MTALGEQLRTTLAARSGWTDADLFDWFLRNCWQAAYERLRPTVN